MKTRNRIWRCGIAAALVAVGCRAGFDGVDDFDDNAKDPARWGPDFGNGVGVLAENNGRLEYSTVGVPGGFDYVVRPWTANASYAEDWEIRVDVHSPVLGQRVDLGLLVGPGPDPSVLFTHRFNMQFNKIADQVAHEFRCAIATGGVEEELGIPQPGPDQGAIRVAFDAATKTLSGYYDANGAECGYSWTLVGSAVVPAAWKMEQAGVFGISLLGKSANTVFTSANGVYLDNFAASSGHTPPLAIALVEGSVVASWPAGGPACRLEFVRSLASPACWEAVASQPGLSGGRHSVTIPPSAATRFFRLCR